MKQELDELLCNKYPKMMVNRDKPMTETTMCWGFECGDGWFDLIDQLMGSIQNHIDWQNRKEEVVQLVTVDQVKEKFGTLRFYYTGGDDYISGMVSLAESMSGTICEGCGSKARINWPEPGGWVRTICESCDDKRSAEWKKYQEEKETK
jgi:hypothetical protein